jgi:hypothetical protein
VHAHCAIIGESIEHDLCFAASKYGQNIASSDLPDGGYGNPGVVG